MLEHLERILIDDEPLPESTQQTVEQLDDAARSLIEQYEGGTIDPDMTPSQANELADMVLSTKFAVADPECGFEASLLASLQQVLDELHADLSALADRVEDIPVREPTDVLNPPA